MYRGKVLSTSRHKAVPRKLCFKPSVALLRPKHADRRLAEEPRQGRQGSALRTGPASRVGGRGPESRTASGVWVPE